MTVAVTRALLQLLYIEQAPSPRTPNALSELLGLIDVRAGGAPVAAHRKTLDLRGAAYMRDNPATRAVEINVGGDVVVSPAVSGTNNNYRPTDWDDASIVLCTLSGDATITGFDAFSCRRMEKLIVNLGGGALTISHQSSSSFQDNRTLTTTAANVVLNTGGAIWLLRDGVSTRWRTHTVSLGT